jgi:hypothetical protein
VALVQNSAFRTRRKTPSRNKIGDQRGQLALDQLGAQRFAFRQAAGRDAIGCS